MSSFMKNFLLGSLCLVASRLAADACSDWMAHANYWRLYEGGADVDFIKSGVLRTACDVQDPCAQFERHRAYWAARGIGPFDIQGDAARGIALDAACKARVQIIDPATQWVQQNVIDPTVGFLNDVIAGRIPASFNLKGKLSGPIKTVPGILQSIVTQVGAIPNTLTQMYEQLAMNSFAVAKALQDVAANKILVDKKIVEYQTMKRITPTVKTRLLAALQKLKDTLPKIEATLQQLQRALQLVVPLANQPTDPAALAAYVKAQAVQRAQAIQNAATAVLEAINRKNYQGYSLEEVIKAVGNNLEARNL